MADQTLDISAYLAHLEAQRAMLNIQIAGVRAALGLAGENGQESQSVPLGGGITPTGSLGARIVPGQVRSDEFFRMSIPDAIKRYLEIMKKPQNPTEIVAALKSGGVLTQSKNFYTTVSTAIKRLKTSGVLASTKTGWALSEWYPNKPKDEKPKKGKGKKAKKAGKGGKGSQKAAELTASDATPKNPYNAFVADMRRAGKTMQEISAAWKKKKAGG